MFRHLPLKLATTTPEHSHKQGAAAARLHHLLLVALSADSEVLLGFDRFLDLLRLGVKKHMGVAAKEARAYFKVWLDVALLKGARQAHALVKGQNGGGRPDGPAGRERHRSPVPRRRHGSPGGGF